MGIPLIVLLIGCNQNVPEPAPDFVTYTPKYVDVVTEKLDTTASGLTEVKSAVKENTEVLLQIKQLVETKPAAGGVEPQEPPSTQEKSPPPAPLRPTLYYSSIPNCKPCRDLKRDIEAGLFNDFDIVPLEDPTWPYGYPVIRWQEGGTWMYLVTDKGDNRGYDRTVLRDLRARFGFND